MTQTPREKSPPGAAPRGAVNLARMAKVWGLLVGCMGVGGLLCWAAKEVSAPPVPGGPATADPLADDARLAALIWPEGLPASRPWRYIVIHHSATRSATLEAIRRYHVGLGFEDIGYHFIINNGRAPGTRDGEIIPTRRWLEQRPGAHARVRGHPEYNAAGIGICLVGNFEKEPPTPAQMTALERLVTLLAERYAIPLEHIVGHGELKNTACPGRLFPMEALVMALRQARIQRHLAREGGP